MSVKKRKRIDDKLREKIKAHYVMTGNYSETAREFGVSRNTVRNICLESDDFDNIRTQKKQEIIKEATEWSKGIINKMQGSIEKAIVLGNRKIDQALEGDERIDTMIDKILEAEDLSGSEKSKIIMTLGNILQVSMRDISTYIGTLYDKQALADGKPTSRSDNMNRNEHTGKDGGPIEVENNMTVEEKMKFIQKVANREKD